MFTRTTILSLLAIIANAYETWHLVDLAQVVCPKPTSSDPDAPEFPDYAVGINYTTELELDAPHIVGFIRASGQPVSITFKIEDSDGVEVVPETTVELQAASNSVPSGCECATILPDSLSEEFKATYGDTYGGLNLLGSNRCDRWDEEKCDELWGNLTTGEWCCRPWCYASPDCPDAYASQAYPGQYFSYAACSDVSRPVSAGECPWKPTDPCACKDKGDIFNAAMREKFAPWYGASCAAWDVTSCASDYRPDQVDTWCCADWCYVDEACPSAIASLNPGMESILFWSDNVCLDDPELMTQCPFKPEPVVAEDDTSCDCLDAKMPAYLLSAYGLNATLYEDYGSQCGPHDAFVCDVLYPTANHAMWCCTSWCWVSSECPSARHSMVWPGHYYSDQRCSLDPEAVSACKYDSACECRGQLPAGTFDGTNFSVDYGSSCSAWDSVDCKVIWGSDSDSGWNSSAEHEWCCDAWCYVNESCPIAKQSWTGMDVYFSYETCDDPALTYNEAADTCDAARRLSSRRRGGSWGSSSSWSSPRRRSPWVSSTPRRRRSYTAPSTSTSRRRAPPPPPSPRRRVVPAPSPQSGRRRTASLGQTNTLSPRRRAPGDAALRRRRTYSEEGSYGYTSRTQMMNNYGGTMPYQTPYGYSGYNAYPAQSNANVAMYGFGGGYVAGSMYSYNNMYGDGWDSHRRRRFGSYQDQGFCIVTGTDSSREGAFMACEQCYRLYGYSSCPSDDSCRSAAGCRYTTSQSFTRDELSATGFIPQGYTPPLKVTFTSITGAGIDTASICPPLTAADVALAEEFNRTMSFKPELFLVLSKQEFTVGTDENGAHAALRASGICSLAMAALLYMA